MRGKLTAKKIVDNVKFICYNTYIQRRGSDIVTVAEKIRPVEKAQEIQLFKELDKGIEDMEAGRVTDHDEVMRILRERVDQFAL